MTWYKRLFWKTFGLIWLGSFLTLLITAFFVNEIGERKRFIEDIEYRAQAYAHVMIPLYEQQNHKQLSHQQRKLPKRWLLTLGKIPPDVKNRARFAAQIARDMDQRVRIIDLKRQQSIFKHQPRDLPKRWHHDDIKRAVIQGYQRPYQLEVNLKPKVSGAEKLMGLVFSIQVVLILLVSVVVALLISAMIVHPLNQLRTRVQGIYRGDIGAHKDDALYQRGDEIGELAREFERMATHIQTSIETQQQLMQNVSHELRAPLARLQAAAGIIEQHTEPADLATPKQPPTAKALQRIMRECQRLDELITQILCLAQLQHTHTSHAKQPLTELVKSLVDDAKLLHPEREFRVQLDPVALSLDAHYLERALGNVLSNACKYSPDGQPIDIELTQQGKHLYLRVRDYGDGVSESILAQLCQPFFRAGQHSQGFGLGLSIAHHAVERMHGTLTITNHPQGGLEVTMVFNQH